MELIESIVRLVLFCLMGFVGGYGWGRGRGRRDHTRPFRKV